MGGVSSRMLGNSGQASITASNLWHFPLAGDDGENLKSEGMHECDDPVGLLSPTSTQTVAT